MVGRGRGSWNPILPLFMVFYVHRNRMAYKGRGKWDRAELRSCVKVEVAVLGSPSLKPVLNWANVCSPEHTSDTSTNYDSFLN